MSRPDYVGQVIIEREFSSREDAERWMDAMQREYNRPGITTERHLWEPAYPIGGKRTSE